MRPMFRPGLQILRRDVRTLQLGLDWPGVGTIADSPALRSVLASIDGFRDASGVVLAACQDGAEQSQCEESLRILIEKGVVVDQRRTRRPRGVDEATWSAWWLLAGPDRDPEDLVAAREGCRVLVLGSGAVATAARRMVTESHLTLADSPSDADVCLVVSDSEPLRRTSDEVMSTGLPHLWAYVRDLVGVVGPFVSAGTTACLRCIDSARMDLDSSWATLLQAAEAHPIRVPPCDKIQAGLVATWAAQEVAMWAGSGGAALTGRMVELPLGCGPVQTEQFDLHPRCGCGWSQSRDTIGA